MTRLESERIAKLEVRVENLTKALEKQGALVEEMHEALLAVRGARWAVAGLIGLAGVLGGLVGKFLPLIR